MYTLPPFLSGLYFKNPFLVLQVTKEEKQPETNTVIQETESKLGPVAHKA